MSEAAAEEDVEEIRQCTHTGRPLGTAEFVKTLEKTVGRALAPQKGGRPQKVPADKNQQTLSFD